MNPFSQFMGGIVPWLNNPEKSRKNGRWRTKATKGAFGSQKVEETAGAQPLAAGGHSVAWHRRHDVKAAA